MTAVFPRGRGSGGEVWSVSRLTARVKSILQDALPPICLEGEISNFTHHSSGHMYFSMKDEKSQIRIVFFHGSNRFLKFRPENGMMVRADGEVTVYERSGQYQLLVKRLTPVGTGELEIAFRQTIERLKKEGLFDRERKKTLPRFPARIGVITSPTGAAIHDVIRVLKGRFPVTLLLYPVRVQGEGAADEIAKAIGRMNELGDTDILVIGRGGGSLEDLWAFNEEVVARAIASSSIPIVSAVGHEVDVTIADLVADANAPTPSAAAEMLVPDREEIDTLLASGRTRVVNRMREVLRFQAERVRRFKESRALGRPEARIREEAQRLDDLTRRLEHALLRGQERLTERIAGLGGRLRALDPLAVLERGYCVCRENGTGPAITDAGQIASGALLSIRFRSGGADARVESVFPDEKKEKSS